ncbi:MAG: sigma-70 family RNA polymerase sigma factor [Chitinophagaceae bacterium]|nr:sigma-70 family RNA polymerase sigma factor [Chitinophagaceae bacterium]
MAGEELYMEKELLRRVADGCELAFAEVFNRYKNKVFHVGKLYLKSDIAAEEAVQEVFMKVWIKRSTLPELEDFVSWLFIVTRNHLINSLEKWARNKLTESSWATLIQEAEWRSVNDSYYAQYHRILQQAIASLSPQQQLVFRLAKEEQLSYDAIAKRLSLSIVTVKTHMHRALRQIRAYVSAQGTIVSFLCCLSGFCAG